jgi:hypothetical protein
MSGLPPAALGRLTAQAAVQDIAVRLISLPDDLNRNSTPVKIQGLVIGQNPDGSVQVQTERGMITMMLRDRQGLPQGQRIELEIPAGRSPQQATIRPTPVTTPAIPNLTGQLTAAPPPLSAAATAAALKLDRSVNVKATEIDDALKAATAKLPDSLSVKSPAAPLQPGQVMRMIPVPPGQPNAIPMQPGQIIPLPQGEIMAALVMMIESLPPQILSQKASLATLVARMDLTPLQVTSEDGAPAPALPSSIKFALQTIDNSSNYNSIRYEPIKQIPLSKPLDVQIAAILPPPARPGIPMQGTSQQIQVLPSPSSSSQTPPPQVIPAQVVGFTGQKLPVFSVPFSSSGPPQLFIGQFQSSNLQPGTPVLLTLAPAQPQSVTGQPAAPLPPHPIPLSTWIQPGPWDSLTDLIQTIQQVNPAMAHAFARILPSPAQPQHMGGLALFFLSVLRSGDLETVLTPQVANLLRQSGKSDIIRAVTSDAALAGRTDALTLPQDWRAAILPYYHDQQVHKLPLYYKRMKDDEGDTEGKERRNRMMRFLFDLKLTRMGNVQIDGFMQPNRLDMIMRTKFPLSTAMQRTMKGLYTHAVDKSNLAGELTFQFKPEHWVTIDIPVTKEEMGLTA